MCVGGRGEAQPTKNMYIFVSLYTRPTGDAICCGGTSNARYLVAAAAAANDDGGGGDG